MEMYEMTFTLAKWQLKKLLKIIEQSDKECICPECYTPMDDISCGCIEGDDDESF